VDFFNSLLVAIDCFRWSVASSLHNSPPTLVAEGKSSAYRALSLIGMVQFRSCLVCGGAITFAYQAIDT
jgi:hypothetical protein